MSPEVNGGAAGDRARPASFRPAAVADATDGQLLAAHVAGDPHAFAELLRRHQDHLWQTALRTSYSREDAADALQDALLSAHRTASTFRAEAEVRSWLHAIVVNACLDRIRRNKTRRAYTFTPDEMPEPTERRDDYARVELSMVVDRALFTLPDEQRAALVLVELEGRSVAEAAELLGVAEGTIKSRCARARARLQERLEFFRDPGNRN
ncbi:RNA polymerase sigma factor SigM [Nocardia thailandica]|uniref:RNA polymerase sigma factor SigM n=1 Tax=Nocardia thailandica TaxID=257275 RepID=UPI000A02EB87